MRPGGNKKTIRVGDGEIVRQAYGQPYAVEQLIGPVHVVDLRHLDPIAT